MLIFDERQNTEVAASHDQVEGAWLVIRWTPLPSSSSSFKFNLYVCKACWLGLGIYNYYYLVESCGGV